MGRHRAPIARLVVDPVACDGIGLCSRLAAGIVGLDRWGFPLIVQQDLSPRAARAAQRAVRGCPRRALTVVPGTDTAGPSTAGPSTAGPSTAGPSTAGPSTGRPDAASGDDGP